jgi:hypothetical protein
MNIHLIFIWSNTVHQASSACYDYFKWGDFLTGNGNDHAKVVFSTQLFWAGIRLFYRIIMICPIPIQHMGHASGNCQSQTSTMRYIWKCSVVTVRNVRRISNTSDTDVLFLYPIDLVAFDERFGSWMVEYGYGNYITAEKLMELGSFETESVVWKNRSYKL